MSDIRIISYLPNPRVYKATIVARHSGAVIEVIHKPPEMANWLDYEAFKMDDAEKEANASACRTAKTVFPAHCIKQMFLRANPFGDIRCLCRRRHYGYF